MIEIENVSGNVSESGVGSESGGGVGVGECDGEIADAGDHDVDVGVSCG